MTRPSLAPAVLLLVLCLLPGPLAAQVENEQPAQTSAEETAAEAAAPVDDAAGRLPEASVTRHDLTLADRALSFSVTAGAVTLTDSDGKAEADIAYVAYLLDDDAPADRPVTFAVNGGPGAASAYLHLGVLGPWRLPMGENTVSPSQPVDLVPNAETWLDFTDLVFIDPVGTGFSRLVEPDDRLRERYLSVDGDIAALADFVASWLIENGRLRSAKYFIGESYGGFRGPLLAEELQRAHGMALSGMTLLSPVLDFGWWSADGVSPLPLVSVLPSYAAAAMETGGDLDMSALAEVEAYAAGDFVVDLLAGLDDEAARARLVERLTGLTGLEPDLIDRFAGRLDERTFARELLRDEGRIASAYDTSVTADDPVPESPYGRRPDPMLDGMIPPLTTAMLALYQDRLLWLPEDRRYTLLNGTINRRWRWTDGRSLPEAVSPLARMLALDHAFRVLVVHGYTDLVTPYFASTLILRQIRDFEPAERLRQVTYPGGHMFYNRDTSRRAFRADAVELYR
jgi:carboxypeptidase C (cathepsin A)